MESHHKTCQERVGHPSMYEQINQQWTEDKKFEGTAWRRVVPVRWKGVILFNVGMGVGDKNSDGSLRQ